jgi:2-C-methyl-D-erythritol 4-phosphate cytidylyltransferase
MEHFVTRKDVCQCVIVVAREDQEMFRRRYGANLAFMNVQIGDGGAERFESIANALKLLQPEADYVAIHDAVRPCITEAQIDAVFAQAAKTGAALLAVPVSDTLKQVNAQNQVQATQDRQGLWLAQTPQVFRRDWLEEAYAKRKEVKGKITDDAQLVEAVGHPVHVVDGAATNIKITTKADLMLADAILKAMPKPKPNRPAHPFAEEEMWGGRGT